MLATTDVLISHAMSLIGRLETTSKDKTVLEFPAIRNAFHARGKDQEVGQYEAAHGELLARTEMICEASPGDDWGDVERITEYSLVLRQVLLHRAINLFEGALSALTLDNVYTMTLAIRGHFETTAALGYLHKRLDSLSRGNLNPKVVDQDIYTQLLGRRDGVIQEAPQAKQVLSLLEHADRTVSRNVLGGTAKQYDILTDCYTFLCEFSHPNFHSHSIAFDLKKDKRQFVMRHSEPMRDSEFDLVEYLLLSSPIFVSLFDKVGDILREF